MKFFLDGISYHVEVCGEGFPLLMLHGFTGRGSNWNPFCPTLGKQSKLIMPDIVGHGSTVTDETIDGKRFLLSSAAKDFMKIIDELGFEKVDILGYSMGGRIALAMAVYFPNRVRKLILESASPGLKTDTERKERFYSDTDLATFIYENEIEAFVDYWENLPLFESQKSLPTEIRSSIRKQRLMNDPGGLSENLFGMGTGRQPNFWKRLQKINSEVLLVVGELDHKFCEIAIEMQLNLQNGKIYKVENAGHAIHVEQPEKFGTIVSEFLSNT
jgi:2-succinyl-6-hydroxy-2,4-cyclohexadiene-1-carboxylate synthase